LSAFLAACGGGSGGAFSPPEPPLPLVVSIDHALDPATPVNFVVTGTDFPGDPGSPVTVRLKAADGLALSTCGTEETSFPGTRGDSATVGATLPAFSLTRDVTAWVTVDFGGGVSATSSSPIASLLATLDDGVDQDLDGVLDTCDPKTYTFESDIVGTRPAGTTPLDAPSVFAIVTVDRGGDNAAAFSGDGSVIAYERFDRAAADVPLQDTTVFADLDPTGGSLNLELGNDGSLGGYAGGSIIFQVQPSNATAFYERQANQIRHAVVGPVLPASGRIRLRMLRGDGIAGSVHLDGVVGGAWQVDLFVYDVPDVRPYRGLEVAASNYYGGARAIRRLTVVRAIPPGPLTIAKAPARSMDEQVFQRGADGTAAIPLRLLYRLPQGGTAEARVARADTGDVLTGFEFADHVFALPGRAEGRIDLLLPSVPQGGNYDVQVRMRDAAGATLSQQALTDVGVGDVYVAAGQSNMSGYSGNLIGVEAPTALAHLFHNDGTWKAAQEPMDDGLNQTDWISIEYPASSCLLSFANELSSRTGVPVGIVPTSLGGTNLYAQWQRFATFHAHRGTLYGSMISRATKACPTTPVRGLLWFQGESDALSNRTRAQHLADLQQLVSQARADLANPNLVFLCGQLGTYDAANQPYWIGVQEAQREAVAADPLAALATAVDLGKADSIHFNVAGYRTMGQRFARGARQRVFGQGVDPTNDLVSASLAPAATSVTLTYERPVTGGAASLYRATDAGGALTVTSAVTTGATVTVSFDRAMGAAGRLAYGYSNVPTDPWVKDAADASPVPGFDAMVVTP